MSYESLTNLSEYFFSYEKIAIFLASSTFFSSSTFTFFVLDYFFCCIKYLNWQKKVKKLEKYLNLFKYFSIFLPNQVLDAKKKSNQAGTPLGTKVLLIVNRTF